MSRAIRSILALLAIGCGSSTGPFQVSSEVRSLRLANSGASAVFYIVIERETATRIDWIPCTDASTCLQVTPQTDKTVPYSDIIGYAPGDQQAILYWWHLVPAPGSGVRADSIRMVQVRLGPGA